MLVKLLQYENTLLLISFSWLSSAKVTLLKFEQRWNAFSPMVVTLDGIFMLVKLVQYVNA